MRYGKIEGIEPPISRLIIGSMVCTSDDIDATCALMDAWVEAGGNAIDTAHIYNGGKSERALGAWMARRGNRERVVVVDKGAHPNSSGARVYPEAIAEDLSDSLERLQTPYIDLYLLHRDDTSVPVGPIVECLDAHAKAGRLRAYGGSNWTAARIQEANDYAAAHSLLPFVASSPHLSLAVASGPMWAGCLNVDAAERAWYVEKQFPMLPWSSQAAGFFTGRYTPDTHTNADVERTYYSDENWARLRRAEEMGARKGVSANNIALAYVLHQPFPIFPLFGPRTVEELNSSLPALDVDLSAEDLRYLETGG
jgi:aryl-alcohol dehydrogenase-like predicted oxidoreductase